MDYSGAVRSISKLKGVNISVTKELRGLAERMLKLETAPWYLGI